jgi:transposase
LALLGTADVGVAAANNQTTACDDAIEVHVVVDHVHVREAGKMVKPLILQRPSARRPYIYHRTLPGILLWVARTDSSWRKTPEEFGKWTTAYRRHELWVKWGLSARILRALGEDGLTEPVIKKSD